MAVGQGIGSSLWEKAVPSGKSGTAVSPAHPNQPFALQDRKEKGEGAEATSLKTKVK